MNNMNIAIKRLQKEFCLCQQDEELKGMGCNFCYEPNNYFAWRVTLKGPVGTPYEGGIFTIRITFPYNYPKAGPEFRFINKIYHLNVDFRNDLGHISLNNINEWHTTGKVRSMPVYGVKQALFDIFCLFYKQGFESPYDEEMAMQYLNDRKKFDEIAKEWTMKYARLSYEV
jgi:ubiquitin-conjugating enzyme E2 D/E